MFSFITRRLLLLIPTWAAVAIISFLIIRLAGGDPAAVLVGQEGLDSVADVRSRLGLDRPLLVQLGSYLAGLLRADLGDSYFLGGTVWQSLTATAPVTLGLSVLALVLALLIGVPLGIVAALKPDSARDTGIMLVALVGLSIPEFVTGLVLILLFSVTWGLLPSGGYEALSQGVVPWLRHLILPAFALGFMQSAYLARMTRASMLEVMNSDYIRTARAKGVAYRNVVMKHAVKNASITIITATGIVFAMLLSGAFITEALFRIPGVGTLVINAVKRRDYPVIQGSLLAIATLVLLVNLLVDCLYAFVDPRIRYD